LNVKHTVPKNTGHLRIMDSSTNNKEGNGNIQSDEEEARTSGATRSSPPPTTLTTAALDLKSVSSPLIPPAQIYAAHAEKMEMEYDARYGATKNVMKGGPELIQDEEVPMPAQAQINQAQEDIESKARARAARHGAAKNVMKGGPELIQEEEVPMPPHAGNDYDEELDSLEQGSGELGNTNTGMADRHTIITNTPHSPPTMTPSIMQPRSNSNPE